MMERSLIHANPARSMRERSMRGAEFLKSTFVEPIVMLEGAPFSAEVCNRGSIPKGEIVGGVLMPRTWSDRGIVPSCVPHGTGDLQPSLI